MLIHLSRFRRRVTTCVALGLLAVSAVSTSCSEHTCTTRGCLEGLQLVLDGELAASADLQIVFAAVTSTAVVPIVTCSLAWAATGQEQLLCGSGAQHAELSSRQITLRDTSLTKVRVTISSGGAKLSEQDLDVHYVSEEINGPGCGLCTTAMGHVALPATSS
jgi:hypothetical protein